MVSSEKNENFRAEETVEDKGSEVLGQTHEILDIFTLETVLFDDFCEIVLKTIKRLRRECSMSLQFHW